MTIEEELTGAAIPAADDPGDQEEGFESSANGSIWKVPDWMKAKRGPGPITAYMEHTANFDGTSSTARIIRGFSGIFDEFDYALLDIGIGLFQKFKEMGDRKRRVIVHDEQSH